MLEIHVVVLRTSNGTSIRRTSILISSVPPSTLGICALLKTRLPPNVKAPNPCHAIGSPNSPLAIHMLLRTASSEYFTLYNGIAVLAIKVLDGSMFTHSKHAAACAAHVVEENVF
ncbi:hypothetical protein NX059_005061 [Plenodomus lindquistii]|nr:hypothetical protein NX059_005061 [Plenodomus lindquistii]